MYVMHKDGEEIQVDRDQLASMSNDGWKEGKVPEEVEVPKVPVAGSDDENANNDPPVVGRRINLE